MERPRGLEPPAGVERLERLDRASVLNRVPNRDVGTLTRLVFREQT